MGTDEALDTVRNAKLVTRALALLTDDDLAEECVMALVRQALTSVSAELGKAHAALERALVKDGPRNVATLGACDAPMAAPPSEGEVPAGGEEDLYQEPTDPVVVLSGDES